MFASEPHDEDVVRARIVDALSYGSETAPNGVRAMWKFAVQAVGALGPEEAEHAARLVGAE